MKIKIVTICGSMRFADEMMKISLDLELRKKCVVLQCVYNLEERPIERSDFFILDEIHKKKIDISDAIYVVNIDGYIGSSTQSEIDYALEKDKEVIYHE